MTTEQDKAYQKAHERFSLPPEERAEYIRQNIHLLQPEDLRELADAVRASRSGDKGAIKRLADKKREELEELRKQAIRQGVKV